VCGVGNHRTHAHWHPPPRGQADGLQQQLAAASAKEAELRREVEAAAAGAAAAQVRRWSHVAHSVKGLLWRGGGEGGEAVTHGRATLGARSAP
jgi:hypothetical protein